MLARNGTLNRFTIAKNHAEVPRNTCTGVRIARKYIDITGPAALATIVVKLPSPTVGGGRAEPVSGGRGSALFCRTTAATA